MPQKLPADEFKWKKGLTMFDKKFIKNYDENSNKKYISEVDVKYPKDLQDLHSDMPFLPERMKINKCNKLVCNLYNKKLCCLHKDFKTSIKSWISFKKGA